MLSMRLNSKQSACAYFFLKELKVNNNNNNIIVIEEAWVFIKGLFWKMEFTVIAFK